MENRYDFCFSYLMKWFETESSIENNDIFPRIIRDDEILLPD